MAVSRRASLSKRFWSPQIVPTFPVELDGAHPLTAGLVACVLAGQPLDLAGQGAFYPSSPLTANTTNRRGLAFTGAVTSSAIIPAAFQTSTTSLAWVGQGTSNIGAYTDLIGVQIPTAPYDVVSIIGDSGGTNVKAKLGKTDNAELGSGTFQAVGNISHSAVGTFQFNGPSSNVGITLIGNGSTISTDTSYAGGYAQAWSGSAHLGIGGPTGWTTNLGAMWARILSAGEAAWLDAEPFGMFRPVVRRSYYGTASVIVAGGTAVRKSLLMGVSQ